MNACRRCGNDKPKGRSPYCSEHCRRVARIESQRQSARRRYESDAAYRRRKLEHAARRRGDDPSTAGTGAPALSPSDRTCPSCKVRHRVPRAALSSTSILAVPLDRYQLRALYALAAEFIEAAGGETLGAGDGCATCGRWSVVAFIDWIGYDVKRQESAA